MRCISFYLKILFINKLLIKYNLNKKLTTKTLLNIINETFLDFNSIQTYNTKIKIQNKKRTTTNITMETNLLYGFLVGTHQAGVVIIRHHLGNQLVELGVHHPVNNN